MSAHIGYRLVLGTIALAALLAGCAQVDPEPDYQRAAGFIKDATGVQNIFDARGTEAITQRRDALLTDGLTANEAVELALLNNPGLHADFQDIGIARADLVQSGLFANPTFAIAFRLPAGGGLTAIDLDIGQNIADLWQLPVRQRAARRNLEQTILRIAHQASELAAKVKQAYFAVRGTEQRLEFARENLDITRATLNRTEAQLDLGAGNRLDFNFARGSVLEAELAVRRARLAASEAKRELAALLGLMEDAECLVLTDDSSHPIHALPRDDLVTTALAARLDVRALREAVRAADERLILEYRRVFPSLELGLSLEREARGRSSDGDFLANTARASVAEGRLTAPELPPRSERLASQDVALGPGFALELPIFDQNQAQIARARYLLEQAVQRLKALEAAIVQDVHSATDQAETAWRIARLYEQKGIPQTRQSLELARISYDAGKTGFLEVLEAERTHLTTRERYAAALEEATVASARLERVVGLPPERIGADADTPAASQPH